MPLLLAMLPGVPLTDVVKGPSTLCLGDFASSRTLHGKKLEGKEGLLHRFGMDDASTGTVLAELAEDKAMPDLTVAYFADNDYRSHEVGPHEALTTVQRVDDMLGRMFDAAGAVETMLQDTYVIVTSDHGHCEILDDAERAVICLDQELADFKQAALGLPWTDADEVMICPNMRAAQVYFHEPTMERVNRAIKLLLRDERVEHVMWRTVDTRRDGRGVHGAILARGARVLVWRRRARVGTRCVRHRVELARRARRACRASGGRPSGVERLPQRLRADRRVARSSPHGHAVGDGGSWL